MDTLCLLGGSDGKKIFLQCRTPGFDPWVGKMPWRRKLLTTPVFLPGEFHGQRNIVSYSPWITKSWTWLCNQHTLLWHICLYLSQRTFSSLFPIVPQFPILLLTAATAAKSLHLCPTLCDPRDSSPPGSPVSGILQARILEWVAIAFSMKWKWKVKVKSLSHVRL